MGRKYDIGLMNCKNVMLILMLYELYNNGLHACVQADESFNRAKKIAGQVGVNLCLNSMMTPSGGIVCGK